MNKFLMSMMAIAISALAGCGGGGGGSTGGAPSPSPGTVVSGVASKGLIRNGTVKIYAVNADGSRTLLKTVSTDSSGNYSADVGTYTGPLFLEASGDYMDEATGALQTISPASPLRAAVPSATGGVVTAAITPLTDIAVQKMPSLTAANISAANTLVSNLFKVDIIATKPVDATAAAFTNNGTTQQQKDYALALAAVSQLAKQSGGLAPALASLTSGISGSTMSSQTAATFTTALGTYLSPTNTLNTTGITNVSSTNLAAVGGTTVTAHLSTSGALPSGKTIGAVHAILTLPAGVTVKASFPSGVPVAGVLTASGVAAANSVIEGYYTPATSITPATLNMAIINAYGFGTGEFATIVLEVAAGTAVPTASQIGLGQVTFYDASGPALTGIVLGLGF